MTVKAGSMENTTAQLTALASAKDQLPITGLGVVTAAMLDPAGLRAVYERWLAAGNRGRLKYLDDTVQGRVNPFAERPWAQAALVYTFQGDWGGDRSLLPLPSPGSGRLSGYVSRYAFGPDYHTQGREIGAQLLQHLDACGISFYKSAICLDTRATPDTTMAAAAGLGAIGYNHLLRTARNGSRVFVALVFVDTPLPLMSPEDDVITLPCAECRRCISQCPTSALDPEAGVLLERCRSYLTIEHRQPFTNLDAGRVGDALFGCDICTAACPPQQNSPGAAVDLDWLLRASAGEVRRAISGTALAYAGVSRLRRNAVAVLVNQSTPEALALLNHVERHSRSPLVRETLARLAKPHAE